MLIPSHSRSIFSVLSTSAKEVLTALPPPLAWSQAFSTLSFNLSVKLYIFLLAPTAGTQFLHHLYSLESVTKITRGKETLTLTRVTHLQI